MEVAMSAGGYVRWLEEVDRSHVALVGGKGANLGELARVAGVRVPPGFCVTRLAYERAVAAVPAFDALLRRLADLDPGDHDGVSVVSADVRHAIEGVAVPADVVDAIARAVDRTGDRATYAVRSSATAEDLPTASFAGQHDTYLNVAAASVVDAVRRCWASLFTERAVAYRLLNGFDHRDARMGVVVQRLIPADAAGVVVTADPVTSNRRIASVEAVYGLGEALVSGRANADVHKVRDGHIVERTIVTKRTAVVVSPDGRTRQRPVAAARQAQPALDDRQVVRLAELGRRIEAHFGSPQDVEWCLLGDELWVVQSRPITALYPIPEAGDDAPHVYVSVGHGQMMTDAMKPLGLSMWLLTTPAPAIEAGNRLFVDVTARLADPASRAGLLDAFGRSDPLLRDALERVIERGDLLPPPPERDAAGPPAGGPPAGGPLAAIEADSDVVEELIRATQASLAATRERIVTTRGTDLFEFIRADLDELKRVLFDPRSHQAIMAGMEATWWLDARLDEWLGEQGAADTLSRSAPHNITAEMGLALLDVADVVRPHADVVAFLATVDGDDFLDELATIAGGWESRDAITRFLEAYGMRCVGEIDITRPRWIERPSALVPVILANVRNFEPGEAGRRFERGRREALAKEHALLDRLRELPGGAAKAAETKVMIDRLRTFIGYREYPKYGMISRYLLYKQALLAEADRLVRDGVLAEREDIFFLAFAELHDVVRTQRADPELIARRKAEFAASRTLTPPRVLTSEGECIDGSYRRDDPPPGALLGLAVSAGVAEGRARVVTEMSGADLEPGDILVTTHTDPSWTPLFVTISGLVTEVGGLMTHGAVIAREYGLVAVVGVDGATRRITDGQRIRVDGTSGLVEILPADGGSR